MVRDFNELQLGKEDDRTNMSYENDDLMDIREAVSRTEIDLIQKALTVMAMYEKQLRHWE